MLNSMSTNSFHVILIELACFPVGGEDLHDVVEESIGEEGSKYHVDLRFIGKMNEFARKKWFSPCLRRSFHFTISI